MRIEFKDLQSNFVRARGKRTKLPENNTYINSRSTKHLLYFSRCSNTLGIQGVSWVAIDAEMSHWHTWSDSLGHVTFGTVAKMGKGGDP